jgi:hypothetical protein
MAPVVRCHESDALTSQSQEITMTAALKLFILSLAVFGAAFTAEKLFVPNIAPIAWSDEPQKLWAVETAFLLRATEYAAGIVAALTLVVVAARAIQSKLCKCAQD